MSREKIKNIIKQNKITLILLVVSIILAVFHGFNIGIVVEQYEEPWVDGFSGEVTILLLNLVFIMISIVFVIIKLFQKPHEKSKVIFSVILLIVGIFIVPAYSLHKSGGIAGVNIYENKPLISLLLEGPYNQN